MAPAGTSGRRHPDFAIARPIAAADGRFNPLTMRPARGRARSSGSRSTYSGVADGRRPARITETSRRTAALDGSLLAAASALRQ